MIAVRGSNDLKSTETRTRHAMVLAIRRWWIMLPYKQKWIKLNSNCLFMSQRWWSETLLIDGINTTTLMSVEESVWN